MSIKYDVYKHLPGTAKTEFHRTFHACDDDMARAVVSAYKDNAWMQIWQGDRSLGPVFAPTEVKVQRR